MSDTLHNAELLTFLSRLKKSKITYEVSHFRDDAITVAIAVPGERWEVEFTQDGSIEVEVFRSDGTISDETKLKELFERFSD